MECTAVVIGGRLGVPRRPRRSRRATPIAARAKAAMTAGIQRSGATDCRRRSRGARGLDRLDGRSVDGRFQAIAPLRQGLDQVPKAFVATGLHEVATKLIEAAREGVVGDDGIPPEARHEILPEHDLARVFRHQHEDSHDLRVERARCRRVRKPLRSAARLADPRARTRSRACSWGYHTISGFYQDLSLPPRRHNRLKSGMDHGVCRRFCQIRGIRP